MNETESKGNTKPNQKAGSSCHARRNHCSSGQETCWQSVWHLKLGIENDWEDQLIQFCKEIDNEIMNNFFLLPPSRLCSQKVQSKKIHNITDLNQEL